MNVLPGQLVVDRAAGRRAKVAAAVSAAPPSLEEAMRLRLATLIAAAVAATVLTACADSPGPVGPSHRAPAVGLSPSSSSGTLIITSTTTLTEDHYGNIVIQANNVALDCAGHTVFGPGVSGLSGGIQIDGGTGVTVRNCAVTGFAVNGIFAGGASDGRYEANIVYGNGANGIHLDFGSGNVVLGNTSRSSGGIGIVLTRSTQSRIEGDTVDGNAVWAGIGLLNNSHDNVVSHNVATRNSIGFLLDDAANANELRANIARVNTLYGFLMRASTNNLVVANTSLQNAIGFLVWGGSANQFRGNTANLNSAQGFQLIRGVSHSSLDSNTANRNLIGIEVTDGSNADTVSRNVANENTFEGFKFFMTNGNLVMANTGNRNSTFGFLVFGGSSFNTLIGNVGHANHLFDALYDGSGTGNAWTSNNFGTTSGI
jgi:parallel beta-helix repeat protein